MSSSVSAETKRLLARWQSLEQGDGLRRATLMERVLSAVGLLLFVFVVLAIAYALHPVAVAVAATSMGWVIAERNALRARVSQWPIFKRYIDWKRVHEDSTHAV